MSGLAGAGDEHAEPVFRGVRGKLLRGGRGAVGGDDPHLIGNAKQLQLVHGLLHDGQITVRAHNNRNFFHQITTSDHEKKQADMDYLPAGWIRIR